MAKSAASRRRAIRSPLWSHLASPLRQVSASLAANASGVSPARAAASGSTQGAKSAGRSSGKVSSRFERSPLGSITRAGMWSIAASSSRLISRPVLPLPVIPTQTAWVSRSRES